jgi:hypothetical protein
MVPKEAPEVAPRRETLLGKGTGRHGAQVGGIALPRGPSEGRIASLRERPVTLAPALVFEEHSQHLFKHLAATSRSGTQRPGLLNG